MPPPTPHTPAPPRADRIARVASIGMTALLIVIFARVVQLQFKPSETLAANIPSRTATVPLEAHRGDLLDRHGRPLAASRMGAKLFVDPERVEEPYGETIAFIAGLLDEDESKVGERLIRRIIANREAKAAIEAGAETELRVSRYLAFGGVLSDKQADAVRGSELSGLYLEPAPIRENASIVESIAAIVGKVGPGDGAKPTGKLGAEQWFDSGFDPKLGSLETIRDANGRGMWVEPDGYTPAAHGRAVRVTIDAALQRIAQEELERRVKETNAAAGRLIMVDPATGEILAMVDHLADRASLRHLIEPGDEPVGEFARYPTIPLDPGREVHPALARNLNLVSVYEPGSTMKPFVWAAVTEHGAAVPTEIFDLESGVWRTDFGRRIVDVFPRPERTWSDVLVHSSNVGMAKGALRISEEALRGDLVRFGFGARTGLGIPGESPGIMTSEEKWSHWTQTSVSSGYEISVTPIQMARAFCAFARRGDLAGTLPRLTLLAEDTRPDSVQVRVIPAWVADEARRAMAEVGQRMEEKARKDLPNERFFEHTMFGKSGTSEIANPRGGGYLDNQHHSSFLAAAPADEPRVVILAVIDDCAPEFVKSRTHFGSSIAGPLVRRVLNRAFDYWGVPAPIEIAQAED